MFPEIEFGGEDALTNAASRLQRFVVMDGVTLEIVNRGVDFVAVWAGDRPLLVSEK